MERKTNGQNIERPRVIPFIRTELSRSEGVRIDNGERTFSFRPVDEQLVRIQEKIGDEEKRPEIIKLEDDETYQHEMKAGQVVSIKGGMQGNNGRKFLMYVPTELDVKKVVFVPPRKK